MYIKHTGFKAKLKSNNHGGKKCGNHKLLPGKFDNLVGNCDFSNKEIHEK